MSIRLKAKDFLYEVKRVSYSLVSYFLKLGIWLWPECVCLCIWNISLVLLACFCLWVLQLTTQVLHLLVVSLCRPVIHKLKPLGRGNWNILNQWAEATKRGEPNFKISVEGSKIGEGHGFWLKFSGGKSWRKLRPKVSI